MSPIPKREYVEFEVYCANNVSGRKIIANNKIPW
jgi:hypothetical protein